MGTMKVLIAATCVAVLAAVGYFFYGEYADAQAREALAERQSIKAGCAKIARDMPWSTVAAGCRERGYIE